MQVNTWLLTIVLSLFILVMVVYDGARVDYGQRIKTLEKELSQAQEYLNTHTHYYNREPKPFGMK